MRAYNNSLRQRQAEQTRTTILEAVRDLLIDAPRLLSIPEIAAKSGVSEPTIYRYFANREALFEAASELLSSQLGAPPEAKTLDDLPVNAIAVARYFERNAAWLRAALNEPALRPVRMAGRSKRMDRLRRMLDPKLSHLSAEDREIAFAAVGALARIETWDCLSREFGLSGEPAGRAMAWAIRSLVESLSRHGQEGKQQLVDDDTIRRGRELIADLTPGEAHARPSSTTVGRLDRAPTPLAPLPGAAAFPKQNVTRSRGFASAKTPRRKAVK